MPLSQTASLSGWHGGTLERVIVLGRDLSQLLRAVKPQAVILWEKVTRQGRLLAGYRPSASAISSGLGILTRLPSSSARLDFIKALVCSST